MPSLKDMRAKIRSVQSTRRITAAMKMVASARFRRAEEALMRSRPYARGVFGVMDDVARSCMAADLPPALRPAHPDADLLLVVVSSDRGLCGSMNAALLRGVSRALAGPGFQNRDVRFLPVGRKAASYFRYHNAPQVVDAMSGLYRAEPTQEAVDAVSERVLSYHREHPSRACLLVFPEYESAFEQTQRWMPLLPLVSDHPVVNTRIEANRPATSEGSQALYGFEPNAGDMLPPLVDAAVRSVVRMALFETYTSEQGARMTAMDSATRNSDSLLERLVLNYNRTRQAMITNELIEIIAGASAV